jgi:predicted ATPase
LPSFQLIPLWSRSNSEEFARDAANFGLARKAWHGRDSAKPEPYFEHALAVAREQQANSWELRAAMSMARLRCDQGKRDEARALLLQFTEGFDTLDLKEAKALLDEPHA